MTEDVWLSNVNPEQMLRRLRGKLSDRKLRLYAVACCRQMSHLLTNPACHRAIDVAERFADGTATAEELRAAAAPANSSGFPAWATVCVVSENADYGAVVASRTLYQELSDMSSTTGLDNVARKAARVDARRLQTTLRLDVFGNPYRPVAVDRSWLTERVTALADNIYTTRSFNLMPLLAVTLEDAGCADDAILSHCRGPGPHVRGCWVVDLVLGKG